MIMPPDGIIPPPVNPPEAVIAPEAATVVKAPAAGVVPPIGALLIVPPAMVAVLIAGDVSVLFVSVCVPVVVATVAPPAVAAAGNVAVPVTFNVPATASVLPLPTFRPTDVPVPSAAKRASMSSRSPLSFVPHVSLEAPTSGFVRFRFDVKLSAIVRPPRPCDQRRAAMKRPLRVLS